MNALFLFLTEKPLERMGINLGTTPFCHSETDQVAFAEAETEISFHLEGAGENMTAPLQMWNVDGCFRIVIFSSSASVEVTIINRSKSSSHGILNL